MSTRAPTGNATDAFVGTVSVIGLALLSVTSLFSSVSASVYVVPVCALIVCSGA
jgi:hypothetical protein